jgi:ADP-ribose pyrophosphatase YjhB (NUDIX family)
VSADKPLYQRDPKAWREHLAEGNATQARKRIGADLLLRDSIGRVLLVDPKYKPDWDLPGGMAEANEPPATAVQRELREELALDLRIGRLLCVDWVSPHGPWDDSLMFIFDGGIIGDERLAEINFADGEIDAVAFCTTHEAKKHLRPYVWQRMTVALQALETGAAIYLQNGKPHDG